MHEKYRHYFNIDPEYFPQINEAIINGNPELWKKFYPHETFVRLMKDTISVLNRKQKVSIWVEGAYGTGKSYAVLTLKKLLDASESETWAYYDKYKDQIGHDLFNQFQQIKSGGPILTVHRYGSSNIRGDANLAFALQDSISKALLEKGYSHVGESALKSATLRWLSEPVNKNYFNELMTTHYSDIFSGDRVDDLIHKLETFNGESLENLMSKIMKVANDRQFKALSLDIEGLVEWIRAVITENQLKAIVFIWDEFTEYFRNNMRALTGFQKIADLSGSDPFYLMIVTHNVAHVFPETDQDWKKISGRFIQPICQITLPENIAFRLMGAALEKSKDPQVQAEWHEMAHELYDRTRDSRQLIKQKARITDDELRNILPIHPYAALLLKHIASAFDSNQRSMFDFIKNDRGEEIKGFQWFIQSFGPEDDNPLLTIDMLWDFFYEKGRDHLSNDVRAIMDSYPRANSGQLNKDDSRVLKTVLLLQAISRKTDNSVELFIPNEKNINLAFEGSNLENAAPKHIADNLVRQKILYKDTTGGKNQYLALLNVADTQEIEKLKQDQRQKSTDALMVEGDLASAVVLSGSLKLRYEVRFASVGNFKQKINQLRNQGSEFGNKIMAVICLAKNEAESVSLGKSIREALLDSSYDMVFIDASVTPLGRDLLEQYVDATASSVYHSGKDNGLAKQYDANAKDVLRKWRNQVAAGEFLAFTSEKPQGERFTSIDELYEYLVFINRQRFPNALETMGDVIDTMWMANSLPAGVECGLTQSTSGQFRSSNPKTKLENFIGEDAWLAESHYWLSKPYQSISKIKTCVEQIISNAFRETGRVSIADIYNALKEAPYGFMPCNLTAFVMGFVLKEYASESFTYSDGMTNDALTITKLKDMVSEIIKHNMMPVNRYKDKFIVTMTEEEKEFNKASASVFDIPLNLCTSIEQTRERIRQKMQELAFPMWCLKYILDDVALNNNKENVSALIDAYCGIANNQNYLQAKSDNDIAQDIGKMCIAYVGLADDLKSIRSREYCSRGMDAYLHAFDGGKLIILSDEVGDYGQYLNQLRKKFDTDAANWVWNLETAEQKIQEIILEYQVIVASNKVLPKSVNFEGAMREWCDTCNNIRISYSYAKNNWNEIAPLMELLYMLKKSGTLTEQQRKDLLEQITVHGSSFNVFYNNQEGMFKTVCSYLLTDMEADAIKVIYKSLPTGMFLLEKQEYQQRVEDAVSKYKDEQDAIQLKNIWKEKTNSESPRAWSNTFRMPVLAMIKDKDVQKAKEAFDAINKKNPDKLVVNRAIAFLEKSDFFNSLESLEARDNAFITNIIKQYSVMLEDLEEVKNYLSTVITLEAYDWYQLLEVDKKLHQMAEAKYNKGGSNRALLVIDEMEIADVKRYLKELIRDNMVVGMEIIKGS